MPELHEHGGNEPQRLATSTAYQFVLTVTADGNEVIENLRDAGYAVIPPGEENYPLLKAQADAQMWDEVANEYRSALQAIGRLAAEQPDNSRLNRIVEIVRETIPLR